MKNASHTTCRFLRRKDLPKFVAEESEAEHAEEFSGTTGVVFYFNKIPQAKQRYSEKHAWLTNTFDTRLNEVAIYHKTKKKWIFLQALLGSRNPVTNVMQSSLVRRYIANCGPDRDNFRLVLSLTQELAEPVEIRVADFRIELSADEFASIRESYQRDVLLLRLYAIQEYGHMIENDDIMWISDELNGSFLSSWNEFTVAVRSLVPLVQRKITEHAQSAGVFFEGTANTEEVSLD
ncbi:MAG: hypothetical protein KDN22_18445 [Verrucomicrobiae bacterium]|nr:hypothetical protein [Verrucomicrobiae bacterium]